MTCVNKINAQLILIFTFWKTFNVCVKDKIKLFHYVNLFMNL